MRQRPKVKFEAVRAGRWQRIPRSVLAGESPLSPKRLRAQHRSPSNLHAVQRATRSGVRPDMLRAGIPMPPTKEQVLDSRNLWPVVRAVILKQHRKLGEAVMLPAFRAVLVDSERAGVFAVLHARALAAPAAPDNSAVVTSSSADGHSRATPPAATIRCARARSALFGP